MSRAPVEKTKTEWCAMVRGVVQESSKSQADIASLIGVTEKHLSQMLNGKTSMSVGMAAQIVHVCGRALLFMTVPSGG